MLRPSSSRLRGALAGCALTFAWAAAAHSAAAAGTLALHPIAAQTTVGSQFTTLRVTGVFNGSGYPTAPITFQVDGGPVATAGCSPYSQSGICQVNYPTAALAAGAHTITVAFAGDAGYAAASASSTLFVTGPSVHFLGVSVPDSSATLGSSTVPLSAIVSLPANVLPQHLSQLNFSVDGGAPVIAGCVLIGGNQASCSADYPASGLASGYHSVVFDVPADSYYTSDQMGGGALLLSGYAPQTSPVVTFSATSLTLPTVTSGGSSTGSVSLTNTGNAALTLGTISLSGAGANLFADTSSCGASLAVGASCSFNVTFSPTAPGSYTATLNLPNNANGPQSIALNGTANPSAITIDTTVATDWKINNGALTLDFNPSSSSVFSIVNNATGDQMVDTTYTHPNGQPYGFYMDNSGFGTVTGVPGFSNVPASGSTPAYLDWWVTYPSSSANAYTYSIHWIVTASDPGLHVYFVANHATSDIAGSIGQVQWVFRDSLSAFPNTYSVDASVNNPGVTKVPLPLASQDFSTDPGRAVQDATVDLHGFSLPTGWTRQFYTKYDHDGYEYLHKAHGLYGSQYGVWTVLPSQDSMVGGPTKQDLYFTGNLLMIEAYSNHLDNPLTLTTAAGTASSRLFGPFYVRFNKFGTAANTTGSPIATPDDMYADALQSGNSFGGFYDNETQLLTAGYVPSTSRGAVNVQVNGIAGLGSTSTKAAWAVLSDPNKNFQFSSAGAQYWADITTNGAANFTGVKPGTYRLSVYVLGQFGEYRQDGIVVNAGATTNVPTVTFKPESFGTTVFNIGIPDRSSHEFLHGHDSKGFDDKEYWGTFNYWADWAANNGSVVFNATAGPAGPASDPTTQWNYNHWGVFDPGLYDATNDKTDNYINTIPSYVASLSGASGTNGVTTRTPVWTVHFATPANVASYQNGYAVLSVALACDYGSYVLSLNGTARTWGYRTGVASDCAIRSGLSGYYQWVAFQYPVSALKAAGLDNVLTIGVSQTYGAMDDAIRLELTNTSAAPSVTGWNDYEYVPSSSTSGNIPANDTTNNP